MWGFCEAYGWNVLQAVQQTGLETQERELTWRFWFGTQSLIHETRWALGSFLPLRLASRQKGKPLLPGWYPRGNPRWFHLESWGKGRYAWETPWSTLRAELSSKKAHHKLKNTNKIVLFYFFALLYHFEWTHRRLKYFLRPPSLSHLFLSRHKLLLQPSTSWKASLHS